MANKTKNDLLQEIEELKKLLCEKEAKLAEFEIINTCVDASEEYKLVYDNYIKAGFTQEQAFDLLRITVDRTITDVVFEAKRNMRLNSHRYYR